LRVLVTGGAGFIGSHLAERLLGDGPSVHVLDDLSTGSMENIRHLCPRRLFGYTLDSCSDPQVVGPRVDQSEFVFHLAAAVGVQLIVDSPVRTIQTNVRTTEVVLDRAAEARRPVFVASTSDVYGKSRAVPFREDGDVVIGPTTRGRWAYACSKALDESSRSPITVFGSGEQQRCFCHVRDVVRALAELPTRDDLYGEVLNIGATEEVSILELAHQVRDATGSPSEIVSIPYSQAYGEGFEEMHRRVPDITKVSLALGWRPTASLAQILADLIAYQREAAPAGAAP
jgi:UDP-glucose 4-epimerase